MISDRKYCGSQECRVAAIGAVQKSGCGSKHVVFKDLGTDWGARFMATRKLRLNCKHKQSKVVFEVVNVLTKRGRGARLMHTVFDIALGLGQSSTCGITQPAPGLRNPMDTRCRSCVVCISTILVMFAQLNSFRLLGVLLGAALG